MKKKVLLTSIATIALCLCLIAGSTFALFTSESKVDISIKAAKVEMTASISDFKLESVQADPNGTIVDEFGGKYSYVERQDTFANGGTAVVTGSVITLDKVTPGDKVSFNVEGANTSDVTIQYRYIIECIEGLDALAEGLVVSINGVEYNCLKSYTSTWMTLQPGQDITKIPVSIELPVKAGNEYQSKSAKLRVAIEAVQGNAATTNTSEIDLAVSTAEMLAKALKSDLKNIAVTLANDIEVPVSALSAYGQTGGSGEYKLGGDSTETIDIDLNGHKLTLTTGYMTSIGAKNDNATITIKNGSMNGTGNKATTWNINDLTFANCNYVFENVVFDKEVALTNTGKTTTMKNVTINGTGDYYALWISARGQNVEIDGLTVNTPGRGIKIDEQYVGAPAKVALSISNAKFDTAKKAAIMVKTSAGADITLNNVDITNTPDPVHAVWVDEDSDAYSDLVNVTPADSKYNESDVISSATGLTDAIANGETEIVLGAGSYDMPTTSSDVTIVGGRNTVITVNKPKANKVTLKGVTVVGSGNYTGIQHSNTVVYEDCLIKGVQFLYAENVIIRNCTIDLTEKADYIWTYGAKNVLFENCTFNTAGKAILIYSEDANLVTNVTVKGCTFNATASALASGHVAAAIEIDSSLSTNGHYTLTTENNTVDSDFSGEWRIKKSGTDNTTVNGVVYNAVTIDGKAVAYDATELQNILAAGNKDITVSNVTFTDNALGNGHYNKDVDVTFVGCTFTAKNDWNYIKNATYIGCTFDVGSDNAAMHFDQLFGTLTVTDCTFVSGKVQIGTTDTASAIFTNCTFAETATTSIWAEKGMRFYAPTTFENCEFNNRVVLAGSNDLALTFVGCTMNGGEPVYYVDNTDGIIRGGNIPSVTIK